MTSDYIHAAMRLVDVRYLADDGIWYAEIPQLVGVWATATNEESLNAELREALAGWIALGLRLGHPFPAIDGAESPVGLAS